jgi:hypothetical protein
MARGYLAGQAVRSFDLAATNPQPGVPSVQRLVARWSPQQILGRLRRYAPCYSTVPPTCLRRPRDWTSSVHPATDRWAGPVQTVPMLDRQQLNAYSGEIQQPRRPAATTSDYHKPLACTNDLHRPLMRLFRIEGSSDAANSLGDQFHWGQAKDCNLGGSSPSYSPARDYILLLPNCDNHIS